MSAAGLEFVCPHCCAVHPLGMTCSPPHVVDASPGTGRNPSRGTIGPSLPSPTPPSEPRELLPCPFCGGGAVVSAALLRRPQVACDACGATAPVAERDGIPSAMEAWNRRPSPTPALLRAWADEAKWNLLECSVDPRLGPNVLKAYGASAADLFGVIADALERAEEEE